MPRRLLFCLLTILVGFGIAHATAQDAEQTPEPQPEKRFIYQWDEEVLFPLAVLFQISTEYPAAELARATLTLQPQGADAIRLELTIAQIAVEPEPFARLEYLWQIPADDGQRLGLRFGLPVSYRWELVSTRDEIARVTGEFIFSDLRAEWLVDQDAVDTLNFILPTGGANPGVVRSAVRPVYNLLAANTGQTPAYTLIIYPGALPYGCQPNDVGELTLGGLGAFRIPCDPALLERQYAALGLQPVLATENSTDALNQAVSAFLVNDFYREGWTGKQVPRWFGHGLTEFYMPEVDTALFGTVLAAARANRLYGLPAMLNGTPDDTLWRAQSYAMVLYLADRFGVEAVFAFATQIAATDSFAAAYQVAFGESVSALLPNLGVWLFTERGQGAFRFSVYQPPTPTPTPSYTPTASDTPTVTPTATNTPTITPTGIPRTPLSSRTPTFTPTPPTPSVTPRPAGSLNTAMPTAQPATTAPEPMLNPVGIGLIVLLLAAIGVLSVLYVRQSRGGGQR